MEGTKQKVLQWAQERCILQEATSEIQTLKVFEEVGELSKAILENNIRGIKDGIGDVTITLIILAALCGMDFSECLEYAYREIKDRKGKIIRGTFIKGERR